MISGLSDEEMIGEAIKIVETARSKSVVLRILGAIAIRIHSKGFEELHKKLNRLDNEGKSFTDVDLIGYSSQWGDIRKVMEKELSFKISRQFILLHGKDRLLYYHLNDLYHVDIFFDKLIFSHDLDFGKKGKGRLELDYPTITVSDLFLEKLQIHEINEKDIKDVIILLKSHDLGYVEGDVINIEYLSKILGDDWGFWMDVRENLVKTLKFAQKYRGENILSSEDYNEIENKVNRLLELLDECPKTKRWQKRAKEGAEKKYWRDVEELYH